MCCPPRRAEPWGASRSDSRVGNSSRDHPLSSAAFLCQDQGETLLSIQTFPAPWAARDPAQPLQPATVPPPPPSQLWGGLLGKDFKENMKALPQQIPAGTKLCCSAPKARGQAEIWVARNWLCGGGGIGEAPLKPHIRLEVTLVWT